MPIHAALSLMPEDAYRAAALPLLEAGEVDAVEWSFDAGWGLPRWPAWLSPLLDHYAEHGRLLGHGVTFSPLSGGWHDRQQMWLDRLTGELASRDYAHVSEHFGFMTAGDFHDSAPLPVPRTPKTLAIGRDRLKRLADAAQRPVGLENLAFAFGLDDVREQGQFLDDLLDPVDGFLLLDLHNLYCHVANFGLDPSALLDAYPLHRVRELHLSGGSWSESAHAGNGGPVRRDTHDEAVPPEVWELVDLAVPRCERLAYVTLERLGNTITSDADADGFRDDFRRMRDRVTSRDVS